MADGQLAKVIKIDRRGQRATLTIDGELFPWAIAAIADVRVALDQEMPSVTVTIFADRVVVIQDVTPDA
jgi:hypothetical protein